MGLFGGGFGSFAGGLSQGIGQGMQIAQMYEQKKRAEAAAGQQQFENLMKIMELPGATREFMASSYLEQMGMGPDSPEGKRALDFMKKATAADQQAMTTFAEAFGLENMSPEAVQMAMKNPSILTEYMRQAADTKKARMGAEILGSGDEQGGGFTGYGTETPPGLQEASQSGTAPVGSMDSETLEPQPVDQGGGIEGYNAGLEMPQGRGHQSGTGAQTFDENNPKDMIRLLMLKRRKAAAAGLDDVVDVLSKEIEELGGNKDNSQRYKLVTNQKSGTTMVWDLKAEGGPTIVKEYKVPGAGGGGGGSATAKAQSTVGKLLADRDAAIKQYGKDSNEVKMIDLAIAKQSVPKGMEVKVGPGGVLEVAEKPAGAAGGEGTVQGKAAKDRIVANRDALTLVTQDMKNLIEEIKKDPSSVGAVGAVRGGIRTGIGIASDVMDVIGLGAVPEAIASILPESIRGDDAADLETKIKTLENRFAFAIALSQNPDGRISDADVKAAREQVKLRGLTSSEAVINRVEELIRMNEDTLRTYDQQLGVENPNSIEDPVPAAASGGEVDPEAEDELQEEMEAEEEALSQDPNEAYDQIFGDEEEEEE